MSEPPCPCHWRKSTQFRILAESQKAKRDELLPMTLDFAEWMLQTPGEARNRTVFNVGQRIDTVSRVVSEIGQAANVSVTVEKFASAPDLRRSFGTRWSKKVRQAFLQKLMRHANIKTTMDFSVGHDSDDNAADLWRQYRDLTPISVPVLMRVQIG
ncbi:hypothetical protein [Planctomicrobium sp. SH664]|uniref:hypothetical protein n=1 Tax=Planctomicrobium sp. SH664 TaxID=3448125 RepID=UPI003F5B03BB